MWFSPKKRGEGRRRLTGRLLLLVDGAAPLAGSFTSRRWSSPVAGQTKKKKEGEGKEREEKRQEEREGRQGCCWSQLLLAAEARKKRERGQRLERERGEKLEKIGVLVFEILKGKRWSFDLVR
ncbi:hypothetical protein KY289_013847 [Solanum tuberosum]|nr:hypothetical protein KY289_013847 [Solanum tuberosum]